MEENSIEFEDIEFKSPSTERTFNKSSYFRKEFRIPVIDENLEVEIRWERYKVSNISSSGFQILSNNIKEFIEGAEEEFTLITDDLNIKGIGIIRYIEEGEASSGAIGIEITSFDGEDKDKFVSLVENLRNKFISG